MNLLDLAKKRCSVRDFSNSPVEEEKLKYILEVARMAPSACNLQPWSFLVLQSEEIREEIKECYDRDWFASAPLYILVCGNHEVSWKRKYDGKDHCDIDIAIAAEHIALAVEEVGLGTCWVCNFDPEKCRKIVKLPENIEPMVLLPIGYPAKDFKATEKNRKNEENLILFL